LNPGFSEKEKLTFQPRLPWFSSHKILSEILFGILSSDSVFFVFTLVLSGLVCSSFVSYLLTYNEDHVQISTVSHGGQRH